MTSKVELLVRGSEKVINHYRFLLGRAKTECERGKVTSVGSPVRNACFRDCFDPPRGRFKPDD